MKHRNSRLLFVALCTVTPALLGTLLHWPALLWGFMCVVTASGSLLLAMTVLSGGRAPADRDEPQQEAPAAPAELPYQETRVVDAALPSAVDGYDFLLSASVWWRPLPDGVDMSDGAAPALAASSIVSRALQVVRHEKPGRESFARYVLEGELSVALPDRSGRVTALAADVRLGLARADRERLRKLNDLRKDEELWERERQHERNKRRYLGDDVLKSPGSAVGWWLARHEDEIEKAVDMIGPLAQISAAANDEEVPELFRHLLAPPTGAQGEATVAGGPLWDEHDQGREEMFTREEDVAPSDGLLLFLDAVGLKPGTDEWTVLIHRMVRSMEMTGQHDAAEEIRRNVLKMPDTDDGCGPMEGPPGEDDTPGPNSPGFRAPADSPFTTPSAGSPTTGAAEDETGERNQGRHETNEAPEPPPSWKTWHSPYRPAADQARKEEDENPN
ncbi:hypothetical protein [Streptomyces sp. BBFR102]|uniref:hypothetical protein n=1 Tax=Streptomyces sp. BBFR102 TaxID=3448171 RepID=UPI003F53A519